MTNFRNKWLWSVVLILISYFLIFHRLDARAIHSWDEALFATRAFYIAHHGEYFTNWMNIDFCEFDHPNTKPPFVTLIQAISFKLFGFTRLALRLPVALIGLTTGILLIFLGRKLKMGLVGLMSLLVLFTSWGYNQHHILRTGDHDTALAFLLLASLVSFLGFQFSKKSNLYLVLFFVLTGCAVLTKSIMGFALIPAVVLYASFFIPWKMFLKNKWFYLGILAMTLIVFLFYGLMELRHPGFLQTVWDEEIGGRYARGEDQRTEPWYFYLVYLIKDGFSFYWIPSVLGLWFGLKSDDEKVRATSRLLGISLIVLLAILSTTDTQLIWYAAPLYPILAFFAGLGLVEIGQKWIRPLLSSLHLNRKVWWLACVLLMVWPAHKIIYRNITESTDWAYERYELYLEKLSTDRPDLKHIRVHANNEWYPSFAFIGNKFKKACGIQLDFITSKNEVYPGDLLFGAYHDRMSSFKMEKIQQFGPAGDVKLWRVEEVK